MKERKYEYDLNFSNPHPKELLKKQKKDPNYKDFLKCFDMKCNRCGKKTIMPYVIRIEKKHWVFHSTQLGFGFRCYNCQNTWLTYPEVLNFLGVRKLIW